MAKRRIDRHALRQQIQELDIDKELKSQLLEAVSEQKKYGIVWEEHKEDAEEVLRDKIPVFIEDETKRLNEGGEGAPNHVLIEGDNLHALTALTYTHAGLIDVIYIDPPYNTGNKDFVYNDSFVDSEDGYRHSKWLSFMEKRLRIAHKLLSDRGVIFISIDDNEQANLKLLCDEVFGGENFIAQIAWKRKKEISNDSKNIAIQGEYILIYASGQETLLNLETLSDEYISKSYNDPNDQYPLAKWRPVPLTVSKGLRGGGYEYSIKTPGGKVHTRVWAYPQNSFEELRKKGLVYYGKDNCGIPQRVMYLSDSKGQPTSNYWDNVTTNKEGKKEILEIFNNNKFDTPKPIKLVKKIELIGGFNDSLILDFFAGSGTTLHATMQLNAEDGGHRKCILVTNNENNICEDVTYERNKRVINGYTTPKGVEVPGLKANNLRYYKVDFTERENTADNRLKLMRLATDMLCVKHDIYDEQKEFGSLQLKSRFVRYFSDKEKQMLVVYEPKAIEFIVKELRDNPALATKDKKLTIYAYSDGGYAYDDEFEGMLDRVELIAMPDALNKAIRNVMPEPLEDTTIIEEGGQEV